MYLSLIFRGLVNWRSPHLLTPFWSPLWYCWVDRTAGMVGASKRETLPVALYLTFHAVFPSLGFCRACTGMPVNRTEGGWGRWGRGVVWGEQRSTVTAFQGFWAVQGERRAGWGVARMAIKYGRGSIETEHRGGQALSVHTYSQARNGDCGSSMFVVHCAIFAQPFICAAVA